MPGSETVDPQWLQLPIDGALRRVYYSELMRTATAAFVLFLAVSLRGEIRLKADLATTTLVALSWTGTADHACSLERTATKATWANLATTKEGKADDRKIAPYATYRYRVNCAPGLSNEITVGPPPAGFHTIAPKPDKRSDSSFGRLISLALDGNGDPAVAFEYFDPNGDGNFSDSEVQFASWDRAAYRWKVPVSVAVVGNYDPRPPTVGISLAHDKATGAFGVTWIDTDNHGLNLALSRDGGATWKTEKALTDTRSMGGASLALADGKVHIAVAQDSRNTIRYMTGGIDEDPGQWKAQFAPLMGGATGVLRGSSLALDSGGAPALAYWLKPATGNVWTLAFWRPGGQQAVKITDSGDSGYPPDGVLLAFSGVQPGVMIDSRLHRTEISSHYSLFSKDQGATWSAPVAVPDDGNEHIGGFMSFALTANGDAAFAGDVVGGNTNGMRCTWPKVARSSNRGTWITCSPQGEVKDDTRTNWGSVIFAPSGMLYVVFQNRHAQPLPAGLLIWGGE